MISNSSNSSLSQSENVQENTFRAAIKTSFLFLPGQAAWSLVVGIAMIKAKFTFLQALAMTLFVFAGPAQLAVLPLINADGPLWMIFLTGLIVNLRFIIFSVMITPHFTHLSFRQRVFWSFLTGNLTAILFLQRYPTTQQEIGKFDYWKGLLIGNWMTWQIGSIIGILLGNQIPEAWELGFAGTLAILSVLLPTLKSYATLLGVIITGIVAVGTMHWPYKSGMMLAIISGCACSMIWEELAQKDRCWFKK